MERIGYRAAVARQPESLATCLSTLSELANDPRLASFRQGPLALVGIGASYQVALAGAQYLRQAGISAHALYPAELDTSAGDFYRGIMLMSASGESAEILDAATLSAGLPRLALCRAADNPLAQQADIMIATESGADNGASSTGYTGMLLAIALLAHALSGTGISSELTTLPRTIAGLLHDNVEPSIQAARRLADCSAIDLVGGGLELATAGEGAILIREAVRLPAFAWEVRNYLHGPMESQDNRTGLIALGDGDEPRIAAEAAAFGCASILLTSQPPVPSGATHMQLPAVANPIARAVATIVAIQMIVAEMQDAASLTDTRFRYPQSDTKRRAEQPKPA